MKDRNVTHPNRFTDQNGNYLILTPAPGDVIEAGSIYNKGNVLPDSVCLNLGIDPNTAEPKDAFTSVASGRFYGKQSSMSGQSQKVGGNTSSSAVSGVKEAYAEWTAVEADDFGAIPADPDGKFRKIYVPRGAARVRITVTITQANTVFASHGANLCKNGTTVTSVDVSPATDGQNYAKTFTLVYDVSGDGSEYFQIYLIGEDNAKFKEERDSAALSICDYFMLEVVK